MYKHSDLHYFLNNIVSPGKTGWVSLQLTPIIKYNHIFKHPLIKKNVLNKSEKFHIALWYLSLKSYLKQSVSRIIAFF